MGRSAPVVLDAFADGNGGWILIIARPLGWDWPAFRDPVTGRGSARQRTPSARRARRTQVLARPGPARRPEVAQAP